MTTTTEVRAAARVVGAVKVYGGGDTAVHALDGVDLAFPVGRFTAIMGPSGSGKSTLMHCAAGLDTLTSGAAYIGDTELGPLDDRRLTLLRRDRIGFVFQAFNLVPTLTDPAALARTFDLGTVQGSLTGFGADGIAVTRTEADRQHLRPGDTARLTFTDGRRQDFTVRAVYGRSELAGDYVITRAAWAAHAIQDSDTLVAVTLKPGVGTIAGRAAVAAVAARYGDPQVQTRDEYARSSAGGIDMMLTLVYALLALAVLIALLGIANTLTLAVHERTRELGLLRAVGQTRAQLRAMVRWESVLVAAFGTAGGIGLGAFLGWVLVRASDGASDTAFAFAVPPVRLAVVALVGLAAGALAALRPARRAARLDVLRAVAVE